MKEVQKQMAYMFVIFKAAIDTSPNYPVDEKFITDLENSHLKLNEDISNVKVQDLNLNSDDIEKVQRRFVEVYDKYTNVRQSLKQYNTLLNGLVQKNVQQLITPM